MKTMMARRRRATRLTHEPEQDEGVSLNVTPLIDVMLVLLVMLIMILPPVLDQVGMQGGHAEAAEKSETPQLHLYLQTGQMFANGHEPLTAAELEARLAMVAERDRRTAVNIHASHDVSYDQFAQVLAMMDRQGLENFHLVPGASEN